MTRTSRFGGSWFLPLFLVLSAFTAVAAVIVGIERVPARPPPPPAHKPVPVLGEPTESIAIEAQVFRTPLSMMAIAPAARRERQAHPRSLKTYRYLRAYPGAPPRIPHELTPDEFRSGDCTTCHERGGYSPRFNAYIPLTPHPEKGECLQCHLGADEVMSVPLGSPDANRRCHQCHAVGGEPRTHPGLTPENRTAAWPQLAPKTAARTPPPIPHDLQSRGNCLACHAGPAAVSEIRTSHPEWLACRQCHILAGPNVGTFIHTPSAGWNAIGGVP
jgi:cytochrome c-type protein NapB